MFRRKIYWGITRNHTFIELTNFSLFMKASSMMQSSWSLKSNRSWTMLLSFSGSKTMLAPCFWRTVQEKQIVIRRKSSVPHSPGTCEKPLEGPPLIFLDQTTMYFAFDIHDHLIRYTSVEKLREWSPNKRCLCVHDICCDLNFFLV